MKTEISHKEMTYMTGIIGVIIGVCIIAGLRLAMAKMSDHGADANGCSGNCSSCGLPGDSCSDSKKREQQIGKRVK